MLTLAAKKIVAPKRLLYGPGPSMVDPRVYEAMGQPVLGIRDPYFLQVLDELRQGLRNVFGTTNRITLPIPSSGSGGMETAVANFVAPGLKFGVFSAGYFAERICAIAERHGAAVVRCEKPWGQVFTAAEAEEFIEREKPKVVAFVQGETATGAYQSGRAIVPAARAADALVIADTVTTLGAMPVELDNVGIDVAFSCSQKGLSCPAGLSPISVSPRAWAWLEQRSENPSVWYFDLKLIARYFEAPHLYHHTPSPPMIYGVHQGLAVIEEEGLENRFARHQRAHNQVIRGLAELGFKPLVTDAGARIWHLTAVYPPAGVNEAELRQRLFDRFDIEIATGLGPLAGKILRIGTMGPFATEERVEYLLDAIKACL